MIEALFLTFVAVMFGIEIIYSVTIIVCLATGAAFPLPR